MIDDAKKHEISNLEFLIFLIVLEVWFVEYKQTLTKDAYTVK